MQGILLAAAVKTRLAVLDARSGAVLASLDSAGLVNHGAALSADGRLCAAATFTADVKVLDLHMVHEMAVACAAGACAKLAMSLLHSCARSSSAMCFNGGLCLPFLFLHP